jgi:tetratricopeptide (TPR) repeat protein
MKRIHVLVSSLCSILLVPVLAVGAQTPTATATEKPAPAPHTCSVVNTDPNEGEIDLAKKDYGAALAFYRAAKDLLPEEISLGVVRSLIGQDKVTDALAEAQAILVKFPKGAIAEIALGEVAYRNADFAGAQTHSANAFRLEPCEGRGLDLAAALFDITAMYATELRALDAAHRLRPKDELIRRDWIEALPRKQRAIELERYLTEQNSLSGKDRNEYDIESQHLKARRPGECRISSKSETTTIPFSPIYGDAARLEAYGLDVAFNGKKRRLQIDTGASGIVLTPGAARRLGLTPEYRLKTGGIGDEGEADSYLTHVASIQIGDVVLTDCMVDVLKKSQMDVDGLIGLDVFAHWVATLDYPRTRLQLTPLPPLNADKPAAQNFAATGDQDDEEGMPHNAIVPPQCGNSALCDCRHRRQPDRSFNSLRQRRRKAARGSGG